MAVKSNFTKEEWQLITDGPEWVFAALAAADGNVAMMTKMKESKAFKKVVKNYTSSSALVKEVVGDETKASKDVKRATLSDAEQTLEEINALLDAKLTRSDADEYRAFLISVADSVAAAAGEGALGIGKKISKKEEKALAKLKTALKPTKAAKVEAKPKPVVRPTAKPKPKPAAKPAAKPAPRQAVRPASKPTSKAVGKKPTAAARPRPTASMPAIPSQAPVKKEEFLAEHTVAAGETLSHISLKYYNSAAKTKYMLIYEANKAVIGDNPNVIVPGQVLNIPKLEE
jgi:LysM repeat protein